MDDPPPTNLRELREHLTEMAQELERYSRLFAPANREGRDPDRGTKPKTNQTGLLLGALAARGP